jgi:type IV secretion system protein VirB9
MSRAVLALVLFALVLGPATVTTRAQSTREVTYNTRSVVHVNAKLRFTTLIVLPEGEEILDFVCGDKDFWVVSGALNLAYVKPAKAGTSTNLNLVTAAGHIYSFLLTEGPADADLKIYVTPDDGFSPGGAVPKLYTAGQVEALRRDAEDARKDVESAKAAAARSAEAITAAKDAAEKSAADRVSTFRSTYPMRLQFPYRFKPNERPFLVSAIFNDGQFTYIRAGAAELPSLYEVSDGAPSLVNFQVEQGVYIVPKVLERGYLVIGKQKFVFDSVR